MALGDLLDFTLPATDPNNPNGVLATPEQIARRQAMADALMKQGMDYSPVQSPWQGAARMANALAGALQNRRLETQALTAQKQIGDQLSGAFGGMFGKGGAGAPLSLAPATAATTAPATATTLASDGQPAPVPPANVGGDKQAFVQAVMPHALAVSQQTGLDPRLVVAQAALESGWGKSAPGNNFFGIKSHGQPGGQTLATTENVNGQNVATSDSFRQYGGLGQSVQGYANFLQSNPRYQPLLQAKGLDAQIAALGKSGYATDPNYAQKIAAIAHGLSVPSNAVAAINQAAPVNPDAPAPGATEASGMDLPPGVPGFGPAAAASPSLLAAALAMPQGSPDYTLGARGLNDNNNGLGMTEIGTGGLGPMSARTARLAGGSGTTAANPADLLPPSANPFGDLSGARSPLAVTAPQAGVQMPTTPATYGALDRNASFPNPYGDLSGHPAAQPIDTSPQPPQTAMTMPQVTGPQTFGALDRNAFPSPYGALASADMPPSANLGGYDQTTALEGGPEHLAYLFKNRANPDAPAPGAVTAGPAPLRDTGDGSYNNPFLEGSPEAQAAQSQQQAQAGQAQRAVQVQQLMGVLSNPYATPAQRQVAQILLQKAIGQDQVRTFTDKDGSVWQQDATGKLTLVQDKGKVEKIGQDAFGNPIMGTRGQLERQQAGGGAQPGQPSTMQPVADPSVHGEDYLKTLPPQLQPQVRAVLEGRAPFPTGMFLKTPMGQQIATAVTQADPSFETGNATARVKVRNEFMAGGPSSPAGAITAGNTAIQHLGHLAEAAQELGNFDSSIPGNNIANAAKNALQSGPNAVALAKFNNIAQKYAEEATKFYTGTGGGVFDRKEALSHLNPNMSPSELRAAIQAQMELMQSKINALQDRWRQGMGPLVPDVQIIQPESQQYIDKMKKWTDGGGGTTATQPTPGAPKVGDVQKGYRFKGGNPADKNSWEPVGGEV